MSMHEIEDLVEDTARMVLASSRAPDEKRRLIFNLYRFQRWFDTSDTTGRLQTELEASGYFQSESYKTIPLFTLVADIMHEAGGRDDRRLVHHWLAALTEALTDLDLKDEVPASFEEMLAAGDAAIIRQVARDHRVLQYADPDAYMRLMPWSNHKDSLSETDHAALERKYQIRYLTDLDADDDRIKADYERARRKR
jgi:hypothetical protein